MTDHNERLGTLLPDGIRRDGDNFGKPLGFGGRNPGQMQSGPADTCQIEQFWVKRIFFSA